MDPQTHDSSLLQMNVDVSMATTLKNAASWARLLGIVGLIMGILVIIMGFLSNAATPTQMGDYESYEEVNRVAKGLSMVIFIVMGILYIIGSLLALAFGNKASKAIISNDSALLESAFSTLRNYFAYWAILMILGLLMMAISIAGLAIAT